MDILQSVVPFVIILVGLVVFHELGHYFTAKMFGVKVLEAGLGYPPKAFGFTWRGTLYSINWLPLGGFVRLLGEEDPSDPQSLAAQVAWKRLIILASGSWMNLLAPVILFGIAYSLPHDVAVGPAVIEVVEAGSPAAEAGLESGDKIISLNGEEVRNTQEVGREIRINMGETIDFKVERQVFGGGTEIVTVPVEARWAPPSGQGPTGIQIANFAASTPACAAFDDPPPECTPVESESYLPWTAAAKGWEATWDSLTLARNQIIAMFHGGAGPEVAGPVGLAQTTGDVVEEAGWQPLLELAAVLSINLAIINLLPLPMLDGGRIAFVLLEVARRGKRVAPEKEAIVHLVGLALILTMAVVVTYFDVARLISGDRLFN
jgi:regulator of sigma E protease